MANVRDMGSPAKLGTKSITVNGTYNASSDDLDGFSQVSVNVPSATLGTKSITENGTYNASSDNLDGYSQVSVNVPAESNFINNSGYMSGVKWEINTSGEFAETASVANRTLISFPVKSGHTYLLMCGTDYYPPYCRGGFYPSDLVSNPSQQTLDSYFNLGTGIRIYNSGLIAPYNGFMNIYLSGSAATPQRVIYCLDVTGIDLTGGI